MPPLTEGKTPGDFLLFEEHDHYCRAEVTIAAGANLEPGTVLGKITASGKFTTHETGVSDGSQTAVAVLVTAAAAESADAPLGLQEITRLQAGKTGALIQWSAEAGARLARADTAPLRHYAQALGLAFQIADDILDVEGDAQKAGKRLQKDAAAGKATFVSLLGLEAARLRAQELVTEACDALSPYGPRARTLREAARFVISRDN